MNVNMIKEQSFGSLAGAERQKTTRNNVKRSLIDGRILRQDEVLDDVFAYCKRQKETAERRRENLPRCIFNPGDINEARYYREFALLNTMEKINRMYNTYIVNDYTAKR